MTGFVRAVRYLTIVPMPGRPSAGPGEIGQAALWFPVVGLILGITLAGVDFVTARLFPGLLGALLTVTAWKLLTGGLHLDGLADCLDGLVGRDREHRLAIMWEKVQQLFYDDVGRVKFGDSFSLEAIRNHVDGWQAKGELPLWNVWLK